MKKNQEQGTALIATLMFLMAMGVLSTALVFTVNNEMRTSSAYKYNQQAYFVANAGINRTVEWFRNSYAPTLDAYTLTSLPPTYGGSPIMLAGQPGYSSNFPNSTLAAGFAEAFGETELEADERNSGVYAVNATLLKHRKANFINPNNLAAAATPSAIERWRIECVGFWGPADRPLGIARVTAIIENNGDAFFDRALWGVTSVDLAGTVDIDSYDPTKPLPNSGNMGAIGSNIILSGSGDTYVKGDVACGPAGTININPDHVTGDFVYLAQDRYFPPIGAFAVGTAKPTFVKATGVATLDPATRYGIVSVKPGDKLVIPPGTYYIDQLDVKGIVELTGDVTLFVKSALGMNAQSFAGDPATPNFLNVYYSGTSDAKWTGGSTISASVYAPNADLALAGNAEFYGSFIGNNVSGNGTTVVHFDQGSLKRNLVLRPFRLITWSQNSF